MEKQWVWCVEQREYSDCNQKCMDTVLMDITSTFERAIELMKEDYDVRTKGYYVIYPQLMNGTLSEELNTPKPTEMKGRNILVFDTNFNELDQQPPR